MDILRPHQRKALFSCPIDSGKGAVCVRDPPIREYQAALTIIMQIVDLTSPSATFC